MRLALWLLLPLTGCNSILGQEPARASLTVGVPFVWVTQNGQASVPFTIERGDKAGALRVHAIALPAGVTAADAIVAPGETSGTLALAADASSTLGATATANVQLLDDAATELEDARDLVVGASGPPGTVDTTWGNGGVVTLPLTDCPTSGYVVDVDSQGRVLTGGTCVESDAVVDLVVARYLPGGGALDTTFGGQHFGYVRSYPGASMNSAVATYPVGLRVDAEDRVVLANERDDPQQHCVGEVRRWTVDGIADTSFTTYSDQVNGTGYSGLATGLVLEPNGQIVLLAAWNYDGGIETLLQTLATDGTPESTYHITLEPGTLTSQHFTQMFDVAMDDRGGFVLGGRQYDGANWMPGSGPIRGAIARVGADGLRDMSFGTNAYAAFDPSFATIIYHVAIDPSSKDILGVGQDTTGTRGAMARLDGTTGEASSFGQMTIDACPGGTSQALTQVMVDGRSRVVATGPCAKGGAPYIGLVRASLDGVLDVHFGSVGNALTAGNPRGAKLAADDRLYVVGDLGNTAAIWRFWP